MEGFVKRKRDGLRKERKGVWLFAWKQCISLAYKRE